MKNKKFKTALIIVLSLVLMALVVLVMQKPKIEVIKTEVELGSNCPIKQIVSVEYGKLVDEDKLAFTMKAGTTTLEFQTKNLLLIPKTHQIEIQVVDTTAPEIECADTLFIVKGESIETLSQQIDFSDNSNVPVNYQFSGDYNLDYPEKYQVTITAEDESGNKSEITRDLIVEIEGSPATYFTTSKGFAGYQKDGFTYIDGVLIANKTYSLPSTYNPGITPEFNNAYNKMVADAKKDGVTIRWYSAFRSYQLQTELFDWYVETQGLESTLKDSAKPGHSEHQSGLAADLRCSDGFAWINENGYKYGFILRYPRDKYEETGYIYEYWHWRYVGTRLASILYNDGDWITIEDYFGITSKYQD